MNETAYKGFRQDEMEYQYNPRVSVPEYPELAKMRAAQARKVRDSAKSWLNVAYGSSPRELLDIYAADKPAGPVLVYIHGGYWRSGSKEDNCNFVPTFTQRGATVVLVEYDLCPQVTVSDIVRQTRSAIAWTYKNIVRYGGDPGEAVYRRPLRRRPSNGDGAGARLGERWLAARSHQRRGCHFGRVRSPDGDADQRAGGRAHDA